MSYNSPFKRFLINFKKNKGAVAGAAILFFFIIIAVFGNIIAPMDPTILFPDALLLPPSWFEGGKLPYLLGTDDIGRDLFSRLVYGARVSLGIGFLVVFISGTFGTILGLIAGYFGGRVDTFIMRCVDILMALPSILLAIVVVSILGPDLLNAILAVSVVAIPSFIRLVRASVITEKSKEYVQASLSLGSSHFRILVINIFPNCMAPLIVQATLGFSDGILNAAALGFLGLGAQAPTAEWGTMLADSRAFIESASYLVMLPGFCISIVVLGFNLLGDGLRDALDPRLKK